MYPPPACLLSELARLIHIDKLIRQQMDMQTMLLMQFEDSQALELGPGAKQEREQMIPTLPRFLYGQQLFKGKVHK